MSSSHNTAAAREITVPTRTGDAPNPRPAQPSYRRGDFGAGMCFAIVLLAVFAQPLLALIELRSREPIAFIHFIGPLCFCLPALPSTRSITKKTQHRPSAYARFLAVRSRRFCLHVVAGNCCASTGDQYSCRVADTLIPLLPCGRRFFLFRT